MANAVASELLTPQAGRRTVSGATRTLEMRQVDEVNACISRGDRLTAGELEVDPGLAASGTTLRRLVMEGSPSFPYLFAVFGAEGAAGVPSVPLHTENLRLLSKALHLHHHWGL